VSDSGSAKIVAASSNDTAYRVYRVGHRCPDVRTPEADVLHTLAMLLEEPTVNRVSVEDLDELERLTRGAAVGDPEFGVTWLIYPGDGAHVELGHSPSRNTRQPTIEVADGVDIMHDESEVESLQPRCAHGRIVVTLKQTRFVRGRGAITSSYLEPKPPLYLTPAPLPRDGNMGDENKSIAFFHLDPSTGALRDQPAVRSLRNPS
jgi:hypothetical protein